MTAPTSIQWSATTLVAVHTQLLAVIDGAATPGQIRLRTSADALLASIELDDPAGTVNGTTGRLTLTAPGGDLGTTGGTVAYAEIVDGDGVVVVSLPAVAGVAAVANKVVLNSLTVIAGEPVTLISVTIG